MYYRFGDLVPHLQQKKQYSYFSSTVANLKDVFSNGRSDNCIGKPTLRSTNPVLFYNLLTTDLHQDLCLLEYDAV